MRAAFLFLGLITLSYAQLATVSGNVQVTAGASASTNPQLSLTGLGLPGILNALPSFSVASDTTGTLTATLQAANIFSLLGNIVNGAGTANFAGGLSVNSNGQTTGVNIFANANFNGGISGLTGLLGGALGSAIQLTLTFTPAAGSSSSGNAQITLTGTTGNLGSALDGSVNVGLFASYSDNVNSASSSGSANANANIQGSVPYTTTDSKTYTYTIAVPYGGSSNGVNLNFKPFSTAAVKSSTGGAAAATVGSSKFSTQGFLPVALNYNQNIQGGFQYAFGNNIKVAATASSGNQGTLSINNAGSLTTSATVSGSNSQSSAPSQFTSFKSNGNALFVGNYYQISGSGFETVLQFTSTPSDPSWTASSFTNVSATAQGGGVVGTDVSSTTGAAVAAQLAASGKTLAWYKSSTSAGAQAAANTWTQVSSTSTASASAGVTCYATVNSYSQWTVGASGNSAATVGATLMTVMAAIMVLMF